MGLLVNIIKSIISSVKEDSKPQQQQPVRPVVPERTDEEWKAYFREILITDFAQYSFREDVPVQDIVGYANDEFKLYVDRPKQAYKAEWGQPYNFVLETPSGIKGVVMIGKGHCHEINVKYLISRMYAKKIGIPYIYFYTQLPNKKDYVVNRIYKFLN
ncbi:MAG: hypothetical protein IKD78_01430 [Bacteroidales bacterium]|jgi:hypothetical protein|nr:hypothetical protein [Bacteroidales bacterium]MBR6931553.1 hypothetical protein [Bacteroidales bacterium]